MLSSDYMRYALEELRGIADYILIDTPPLLGVLDGTAVARFASYTADGYRHQIPPGLTAERLDRGEAKPGSLIPEGRRDCLRGDGDASF